MFREAGDKYRVYSRKAQLGSGGNGARGWAAGGQGGGLVQSPDNLGHPMRPLSRDVWEMFLPHHVVLGVSVPPLPSALHLLGVPKPLVSRTASCRMGWCWLQSSTVGDISGQEESQTQMEWVWERINWPAQYLGFCCYFICHDPWVFTVCYF